MLQTTAAPSILPSADRPIPLQKRPDLIIESMSFRGVPYLVVKDPIALKYHRLRPEQRHILEALDGKISLEGLRERMQREYPGIHWTPRGMQQLIADLHEKRLLYSDRTGQEHGISRQRRKKKMQKIKQVATNFLFLRLPGWDPAATLRFLYPWVAWMFHPLVGAMCVTAVVGSLGFLAIHFDEFTAALPAFQSFFTWPNVLFLWLTIAVTKIIHEFGHGLSCYHFGGECHEMGVMLLVFSPTLYCDVSDSWMMKNKWQRIIIGAGGMYIEAVISAVALAIWWNTQPGQLINMLALNVFFICSVSSVIFNLNPLMRLDGYYMLADWLEIPNLRQRADKLLLESFGKYCLGIDPPPDPFAPDSGRAWFVAYSICAALYKWFIVIAISFFLYTVLKPYRLQSLGVAIAMMSAVGFAVRPITGVTKMLKQPREKPLSKPKMIATVCVLGLVAAAVLRIPVPTVVTAAFYLEPQDVRHVYTLTPGTLVEVTAEDGQTVRAGDVLARLENPDLMLERDRLVAERRQVETRLQIAQKQQNSAVVQNAREELVSIGKNIAKTDERLAKLVVRSPADGVFIAPPLTPAPTKEQLEEQLPRWYGVPLDERNLGAVLDVRTHVGDVAPVADAVFDAVARAESRDRPTALAARPRGMNAMLLIDQADRYDVAEGQLINIKFDHLPQRKFPGQIAEIAQRQQETAPQQLSSQMGGSVATVTTQDGREMLTSVAYQATVPIDNSDGLLMPGLRGKARLLVQERPLWLVLNRVIKRTFNFRL